MPTAMKILDKAQIQQKIKRLAIEILENHFEDKSLILAGINNNGTGFARLLAGELEQITKLRLQITTIRLNRRRRFPPRSTSRPTCRPLPARTSSSRTTWPIRPHDLLRVQADPRHPAEIPRSRRPRRPQAQTFPFTPITVGMSLATTLKENIDLRILDDDWGVYLD